MSPEANHPEAASPVWITPALIADTLATWQPYYDQPLTEDDAIEILQSVGLLLQWIGDEHEQAIPGVGTRVES